MAGVCFSQLLAKWLNQIVMSSDRNDICSIDIYEKRAIKARIETTKMIWEMSPLYYNMPTAEKVKAAILSPSLKVTVLSRFM